MMAVEQQQRVRLSCRRNQSRQIDETALTRFASAPPKKNIQNFSPERLSASARARIICLLQLRG